MRTTMGWINPAAIIGLSLAGHMVSAIDLDLTSPDSIRDAAKSLAEEAVDYYPHGEPGDAAGILPDPYSWAAAGTMFGALIDYWHYTGDDQFNDMIQAGMDHQSGEENSYEPLNITRKLNNLSQAAWGLSAMTAAEHSFPRGGDSLPSWEEVAQNVFNRIISRWDDETCDGGIRMQINNFSEWYDYKDTKSNAYVFELSSRMARLNRENETYTEWADKIWEWSESVGLITEDFEVFSGTNTNKDCSSVEKVEWSSDTAAFLSGAANMYNITNGDSKWKSRVDGLIKAQGSTFFKDDIMVEPMCEGRHTCNFPEPTFYKSLLARTLGTTVRIAPYTEEVIMPRIQASAKAAAKFCVADGDDDEMKCGRSWVNDTKTGRDEEGLGEFLAALQIIQTTLDGEDSTPTSSDGNGSSTESSDDAPTNTADSGGFRLGVGYKQSSLVMIGLFFTMFASM